MQPKSNRLLIISAAGLASIATAVVWYGEFPRGEVLTRAAQVRALSARASRRGYPVRIEGSVTAFDYDTFVLNDVADGVRFELP